MHEIFQTMPDTIFAVIVGLPLLMAVVAVVFGWKVRQTALRSRAAGQPRSHGEDALAAGVTVAVVPLAFAIFMLWGRLG